MKLDVAQKAVNKLEEKRDTLRGRLAAVEAERQVLEGRRLEQQQAAYGRDDQQAEGQLQKTKQAIDKCCDQQEGISAELVAVTEDLNAARETLRSVKLEAAAVELRRLDDQIEEINTKLRPLVQRRQTIVGGWDTSDAAEARERLSETTELATAVEVHQGFSIRRTITSGRAQ